MRLFSSWLLVLFPTFASEVFPHSLILTHYVIVD